MIVLTMKIASGIFIHCACDAHREIRVNRIIASGIFIHCARVMKGIMRFIDGNNPHMGIRTLQGLLWTSAEICYAPVTRSLYSAMWKRPLFQCRERFAYTIGTLEKIPARIGERTLHSF